MSRYIDADALKESMRGEFIDSVEERIAIREIDEAPTIEIVRCKECIFADLDEEAKMYRCGLVSFPHWNRGEHFCSYGERRTDD